MGAANHWIALRLIGATSNRDGIGARVTVRSGGLMQVNRVIYGIKNFAEFLLALFKRLFHPFPCSNVADSPLESEYVAFTVFPYDRRDEGIYDTPIPFFQV